MTLFKTEIGKFTIIKSISDNHAVRLLEFQATVHWNACRSHPQVHPQGAQNHSRALSTLQIAPRMPAPNSKSAQTKSTTAQGQQATSLIVLSDSDDEVEMIVTEKSAKTAPAPAQKKPIAIPPELMQRMSEGGISISPIKPAQPAATANQNTQLVVVVNETGSHYALALPNGSKLILTPEQVAQIRASNGGKLVL